MTDKRTVYEIIKDGCPNCHNLEDLWVEFSIIETAGVLADEGKILVDPQEQLDPDPPTPYIVHCNDCDFKEEADDWGAELVF